MYGMVNQAIRSMVNEQLGAATWEEICKKANLDPAGFSSFKQYDDSITAELVGLVCEKTQQQPATILESFGQYWIGYAKKSEYQSILTGFASNPVELIESLDSLHSRLQLSFENLRAPSFWVTKVSPGEILVHYKSQRNMGLEYFVVGLLKGIFKMYDQECQVEVLPPTKDESAIFKVIF
jgi:Haem-NO-binding